MVRNEDIILEEINKVMDNFVDRVFELSQQALVDSGKIDTGTMLKTANIQRDFLHKTITYPTPYASSIHNGRNKGGKMYSPWLWKWVRRKLQITDEKEVKQVAYAIAKSIEKRGIEPFPFLLNAIEQTKGEFRLN